MTPSGRAGIVVALESTADGIEVTVEWPDGDRGSFRDVKLRPRQ